MRQLYVLEVKDSSEVFKPQIGFGELVRLEEWMEKFIPVAVRLKTEQWRIVKYIPLILEAHESSLIH